VEGALIAPGDRRRSTVVRV